MSSKSRPMYTQMRPRFLTDNINPKHSRHHRIPPSTALYILPSLILRRWRSCMMNPIIRARSCVPHCSYAKDSTMLMTTAISSVVRAENGKGTSSRRLARRRGRTSRTTKLKAERQAKENMKRPFVHIGRRYGAPMLNTAATRMY